MSLGNLIRERISNSIYSEDRVVYQKMKEIIGEECCDYKTFINALNANRGLSDEELFTLCILLDIDLNKEVMKYSMSREILSVEKCTKITEFKIQDYYEDIKEDILLFLNTYVEDVHTYIGLFQFRDLHVTDNKILAVAAVDEWNLLAYYEVEVERTKDSFIMSIKDIWNLEYLKDILERNSLTYDELYNSPIEDRLSLARKEGELYSKNHPGEHYLIEKKELKEFRKSFIDNRMLLLVEAMKDDMEDFEDKFFYYDDEGLYDSVKKDINATCRDLQVKNQSIFEGYYTYATNFLRESMKKEGFPSINIKGTATERVFKKRMNF